MRREAQGQGHAEHILGARRGLSLHPARLTLSDERLMGVALRLIRARDPNYGAVKLREKVFSHVLFNLNIIATDSSLDEFKAFSVRGHLHRCYSRIS